MTTTERRERAAEKKASAARMALTGDESSLSFKIRGSKKVTHIKIALDPSDTYTVTFSHVRGMKVRTVAVFPDVYVDSLHTLIERTTGLYTSL